MDLNSIALRAIASSRLRVCPQMDLGFNVDLGLFLEDFTFEPRNLSRPYPTLIPQSSGLMYLHLTFTKKLAIISM